MAQKFVALVAVVCVLFVVAQSASLRYNRGAQHFNSFPVQPQHFQTQPQYFQAQPQQFQAQPHFKAQPAHDPERQSRFLVVDEKFQQDPNTKEYNFAQTFVTGEQYNEEGKLKTVQRIDEEGNVQQKDVIVTRGSYTILEKDGSMTIVNYTADENGFHPEIVTQAPAGK